MPSIGSLHLARHLLRRAHEDAVRRNADDIAEYATAHEEFCELLGKVDLLTIFCEFPQDHLGDRADVSLTSVVGAAIGVPHPIVLDFKAAFKDTI